MSKEEKSKAQAPSKEPVRLRKFSFPKHGMVIEAESYEAAQKIFEERRKSEVETEAKPEKTEE